MNAACPGSTSTRSIVSFLFGGFSAALLAAAFARGNYLLGWHVGIVYVLGALALLWLFARATILTHKPSWLRGALVVALGLPLCGVMADPAAINSDVQVAIEYHAVDRAARRELNAVFASDPAFDGLSISTRHRKVVNVQISGSLIDRAELDRLRHRVAMECPTVGHCVVTWDVAFRH